MPRDEKKLAQMRVANVTSNLRSIAKALNSTAEELENGGVDKALTPSLLLGFSTSLAQDAVQIARVSGL